MQSPQNGREALGVQLQAALALVLAAQSCRPAPARRCWGPSLQVGLPESRLESAQGPPCPSQHDGTLPPSPNKRTKWIASALSLELLPSLQGGLRKELQQYERRLLQQEEARAKAQADLLAPAAPERAQLGERLREVRTTPTLLPLGSGRAATSADRARGPAARAVERLPPLKRHSVRTRPYQQ